MLLNNLDSDVAELAGGSRRLRRDRSCGAFARCVERRSSGALLDLGDDETLLVQSGKPVCRLSSRRGASPRVLIANSLLVPKWATRPEFRRLEAEGLTMFGQMTAGSWIYIGTQGILQGTYQTFGAAAQGAFRHTFLLAGRTILTAGLGGMGGAQPLAGVAGRRGGAVHRSRPVPGLRAASRRATWTKQPNRSTTRSRGSVVPRHATERSLSVGLLGNAADVVPELARSR